MISVNNNNNNNKMSGHAGQGTTVLRDFFTLASNYMSGFVLKFLTFMDLLYYIFKISYHQKHFIIDEQK